MTTQTNGAYQDAAAADRAGRLTPEQQRFLSDKLKSEAAMRIIVAALFTILCVLFALYELLPAAAVRISVAGYVWFGGLCSLSVLPFTLFVVLCVRLWRTLQEVRAWVVERANARVAWHGHSYNTQVPGPHPEPPGLETGARHLRLQVSAALGPRRRGWTGGSRPARPGHG